MSLNTRAATQGDSPAKLALNKTGEVFVVGGNGRRVGKIDLGADSGALWDILNKGVNQLLRRTGVHSLNQDLSSVVFSVSAMRKASPHLFAGCTPLFDEEKCRQYRWWLEQLEQY